MFNRGTDAVRQVGSTMKPIGAHALALAQDKINWSHPVSGRLRPHGGGRENRRAGSLGPPM